jgi:hypothetical protein
MRYRGSCQILNLSRTNGVRTCERDTGIVVASVTDCVKTLRLIAWRNIFAVRKKDCWIYNPRPASFYNFSGAPSFYTVW